MKPITLLLALASAAALSGCSTPGEPSNVMECVKTTGGKASVTERGIEVLQPGRCTEWTFSPTLDQDWRYRRYQSGVFR